MPTLQGVLELPEPSGLLVARGLREVAKKARSSAKQTGDSKLLGHIIIFSGLKRNINYSLLYQNIEICFILKRERGIPRQIR